MSICYGCGQDVILALTPRGKLLPLQPYPDPAGPLAVSDPGPGHAPAARYLRGADTETDAEVRMSCHWDRHPGCKGDRRTGGRQRAEVA